MAVDPEEDHEDARVPPDVERLTATLRLVRRTTRCPEYVAAALAKFEARQTRETAYGIVDAAERLECRSDAPEYLVNEVYGVEDVMVSEELAHPTGQPRR